MTTSIAQLITNDSERWKQDGNKKLRERQPCDFLFTILQRTSPDMERYDIGLLESRWKDRLHTRDFGLNDN